MESRATAPSQARVFDVVDDRVRLHAQRFLNSLIAVQFQVAIDIRRTHAKALGDDLDLVGMGGEKSHFVIS